MRTHVYRLGIAELERYGVSPTSLVEATIEVELPAAGNVCRECGCEWDPDDVEENERLGDECPSCGRSDTLDSRHAASGGAPRLTLAIRDGRRFELERVIPDDERERLRAYAREDRER